MDIITGYRGTPHITSMQDRAKNQGVIGEGSYILDVGQQLAAEIVSANEIRVRDGVLSHQGCVANIAAGAYDSLEISNGTQGMLRTDLIVARYTKDAETNVEDISLVVIEGEAAASAPATPSYNEGDIQSGDSPVDMPLYKVNINSVTISSVDLIADTIWSLQSIGDTALPTTAQTISGAIAEHEEDISQINGNLIKKFIETNGPSVDLTTTYTVVPCTYVAANPNEEYFGTGSNGIVCKKSGRVLMESWARAINLTAGDLVGIQFCVYRNGSMLWDSYGAAASGKTTLSLSLIRQVRDVEAGDIICLRAYNSDGARGKLSSFRMNVEYL